MMRFVSGESGMTPLCRGVVFSSVEEVSAVTPGSTSLLWVTA
jgi:hypothetical protein